MNTLLTSAPCHLEKRAIWDSTKTPFQEHNDSDHMLIHKSTDCSSLVFDCDHHSFFADHSQSVIYV